MKFLYSKEHCSCFNYEKGEGGAIQIRTFKKNERWNEVSKYHKIVFLLKGQIKCNLGIDSENFLAGGNMFLFPSDIELNLMTLEDSDIIVVRLPISEQLCDVYSFEKLLKESHSNAKMDNGYYTLSINERMDIFLELLKAYITEGLRCTYFFQIKIKEMLFIFRAYYSKEELLRFFHPLLTSDISFSEFVLKHKNEVRTVKEFAELSNYSLSGFQKRFKKVFGVTAHKWLNEHRSKSILHEINKKERTLKEISNKYGFSSQSYFNDFCKTNFGLTPGQLRNHKIK